MKDLRAIERRVAKLEQVSNGRAGFLRETRMRHISQRIARLWRLGHPLIRDLFADCYRSEPNVCAT